MLSKSKASQMVTGATVSLAGAVIGGLFVIIATNQQIEASVQQSQTSFLREQRITAYADYVKSIDHINAQEQKMLRVIDRYITDTISDEEFKTNMKDLENLYSNISASENYITIVGSEKIRLAASSLTDAHGSLLEHWNNIPNEESVMIKNANISFYDSRLSLAEADIEVQDLEDLISWNISGSHLSISEERYDTFIREVRSDLGVIE